MRISGIRLADGQFVGALSVELSPPRCFNHRGEIVIFDKMGPTYVATYRRDAENLLIQIFQGCRNIAGSEASIEIL